MNELLNEEKTPHTVQFCVHIDCTVTEPKIKKIWGLNICLYFDLRDSKKIEIINKLKNIFHYKNIDIHKTAYPHS